MRNTRGWIAAAVGLLLVIGGSVADAGPQSKGGTSVTATIAVGVADTSSALNTQRARSVAVFVSAVCDSGKITIQHSLDNSVWTDLIAATQINSDGATDKILFARSTMLLGSDGNTYAIGPPGMWLRTIINNDDSATGWTLVKVRYVVED